MTTTDDFKEQELKLYTINSLCEEHYYENDPHPFEFRNHHSSTNSNDTQQSQSQSEIDDSATTTTTTTLPSTASRSYRRNAFSSFNSSPSHQRQSSGISLSLNRQSTLSPPALARKHTKTSSIPDLFLNSGSKSAPIDTLDMDGGMSMKRKNSSAMTSSRRSWKLKRQMSSDALLNRARSLQSYTNQALVKLKHIPSADIYHDSDPVKHCKQQLTSVTRDMNEMLEIASHLYAAQCSYVQAAQSFSSTVHSCIDLGRNRSATPNFFGVYLKMMASTMKNVGNLCDEYKSESLREFMLEPLEALLDSPQIQKCVNLRWQYSKVKNNYNRHQTGKDAEMVARNLDDLKDVEGKFVTATQKLIRMRADGLLFKFMNLQQSLFEFSVQKSALIRDKTRINAYDEMKALQFRMKTRVQNEILHVATDEAFAHYFETNMAEEKNSEDGDGDVHVLYTMVLFHREKFPPSTQFLFQCFGPLSQKMSAQQIDFLRFIIVHYKCTQTIAKYNINMFPTCLVFENDAPSRAHRAIVGNTKMTQNELQFIVEKLCAKHTHANDE